jgi:AcrR family transcriptional regulator
MRGAPHCAPSADGEPYFARFVEGRRGEILDAALHVFAEKGYERGTMRDIATHVGVTEPALYRHYAGKEALFEDLVAVAGEQVLARATSTLDGVNPENLRESLLELVRARRRGHAVGDRPVIATLLMAGPNNPAFLELFQIHIGRPMTERLGQIVAEVDRFYGIERSEAETAVKFRLFVSLFVGYHMTTKMLGDVGDDDALVDGMLAIMGWDQTD